MKFLDILNSIQLLTGIILVFLAVYASRYRTIKISQSLIWFLLLTSLWCFMAVLMMNFGQVEEKILFNRIRMLCPIFLPASILSLALDINGEIEIKKSYIFALPCLFALCMISPWHELMITNYRYVSVENTPLIAYGNGPLFFFHNILSRLYCLVSFWIIFRGMKGRHGHQKITSWIIICAIVFPFLVDTAAVYLYESLRYMHIVPVSLGFTSVLIIYALFVHGALELVPYARSMVVSYLSEPCLMWDYKGILVDCNEAASKLLNIPYKLKDFNFSAFNYLKMNNEEVVWEDGRVFQVRYENIYDSFGNSSGSFSLMRDITGLKMAEEKLIKLNNVKTSIMGVLSHDMRGHVGQLGLITELLVSNQKSLTDLEKNNLNEGALFITRDLNFFLENLLDWSKEQVDELAIREETFYVKDVVTQICTFLSKLSIFKNQKIANEVSSNFKIKTDSKILEIILRNLIYNAIKHSPNDSLIKIWSAEEELHIENQCEDFNLGLVNDYFSSENSSDSPGNGLGYQICKEFTKVLSLKIRAERSSNGVVFSVSPIRGMLKNYI